MRPHSAFRSCRCARVGLASACRRLAHERRTVWNGPTSSRRRRTTLARCHRRHSVLGGRSWQMRSKSSLRVKSSMLHVGWPAHCKHDDRMAQSPRFGGTPETRRRTPGPAGQGGARARSARARLCRGLLLTERSPVLENALGRITLVAEGENRPADHDLDPERADAVRLLRTTRCDALIGVLSRVREGAAGILAAQERGCSRDFRRQSSPPAPFAEPGLKASC